MTNTNGCGEDTGKYDFYGCERNRGWRWVMVPRRPSVRPAQAVEFTEQGVEFPTELFAEAHAQYLAQRRFMDVEWCERSQPEAKQRTRFDVKWRYEPWPREVGEQPGSV